MDVKELQKYLVEEDVDVVHKLMLYNSNHLWEDVIRQLQKATGYDIVHCEQIAVIAHIKGQAVVKSGKTEELTPIDSVLKEIYLITEII